MQFRPLVCRGLAAAVFAVFALAACGGDGEDFADAGRDATIDAPNAPAGMLPTSIPLAITDCGATSQQTFTVMNSGTADLTYSLALSDAAFTVTPASGTIVAGATTTFTVSVTVPTSATAGTALTATLTATTNLPGSPHSVPVTVTPRGAHITLTPPSVGFGQVEAGTTSTGSQVLVANTGNAPATVTIAAPGGEFNRLFGTSGTLNLAGGQSADATFTYAPTNIGADSASSALTITGVHCGTAPTTIPLTGTGEVTGGVLVQGTPVDFGNIACGTTSSTATVTLMNTAEIAASYTATFPTDAEGDDTRYSVTPASGSVPANSSVQLTITRIQIGVPFQPRAVNAIMRVNVNIPASTDTDVPIAQTLTGSFLTATPTTQDFGYASVGGSRTGPVTITNSGNTAATLQTTVSAPFSMALPAMVGAAGNGSGTFTYTPSALGTVTGTASVTAPNACSNPVAFSFSAGNGPLVQYLYTYGASGSCPVGATLSGPIFFGNVGNQNMTVTCVDTGTNDLNAQFTAGSASPDTGSQVDVTVSTGAPIRAGNTTTMVRCTTNEPLGNTYDVTYTRFIAGSDLVMSSAAPLDFTCFVTDRQFYTIANAATSTGTPFIMPTSQLVFPLAHDFTQMSIGPGSSYQNSVTTYGGGSAAADWPIFHGVPDPCSAGGTPGTIIFTGEVSAGSGSGICSVTPPSLPVVLRAGTPAAQ